MHPLVMQEILRERHQRLVLDARRGRGSQPRLRRATRLRAVLRALGATAASAKPGRASRADGEALTQPCG